MDIFKNKDLLNSKYIPSKELVLFRDEQIEELKYIYDSLLNGETPSNIVCFGKSGSGKTLINKLLMNEAISRMKNFKRKIIYLKCERLSEFQAVMNIINTLGGSYKGTKVDFYTQIENLLRTMDMRLIIILDEIDSLLRKSGDRIIYEFSRMNEEFMGVSDARISMILITNDLTIKQNMRPKTISSLGETNLIFPPYNAIHLNEILRKRAKDGFKEGVVDNGVIEKCAALAAQEHGDARKAIDLLRATGEIAERKKSKKVLIEHVDKAEERIDSDTIMGAIKIQPRQSLMVLKSIIDLSEEKREIMTGDVFSKYYENCNSGKQLKPLSQRRISDLISELDYLGIITASIAAKGKYGKTRLITTAFPSNIKRKITTLLDEIF